VSWLILIAGASGDLATAKIYPAFFRLWQAHQLPNTTLGLCGIARTRFPSSSDFQQRLRPSLRSILKKSASNVETVSQVDEFLQLCDYQACASYNDAPTIQHILETYRPHNVLVYLATPPSVFAEFTQALRLAWNNYQQHISHASDNNEERGIVRLVVEKPLGHDTDSCRSLLNVLHSSSLPSLSQSRQQQQETLAQDDVEVFHMDHYLGKVMVYHLPMLRQTNPWLSRLFHRDAVQSVHIVWKEPPKSDNSNPGGYFDAYGIVRDVMQNHLMQLLCLVAMELPHSSNSSSTSHDHPPGITWTADELRDAKVAVLKSMPVIRANDCLVGQYEGYTNTPDTSQSRTPTYAMARLWINTSTWHGVPFYLEAGKALDQQRCEIRLQLRGNHASALVFRIQPNPAVVLEMAVPSPNDASSSLPPRMVTIPWQLLWDSLGYPPQDDDAYARILHQVLQGEVAQSVRSDEMLASWALWTPALQDMEEVRPVPYRPGSTGPAERSQWLSTLGGRESAVVLPMSKL
jgi:glucose-6-phosphate 1-dehydrogenase